MIKILLKLFVKNSENTENTKVREDYCTLSGVTGVICNAFLFAIKITVGLLAGSMAIISDAFNNLSDIGTSLVSVIGAKLSNKKPDNDHPFGHGRLEYVASLVISFLIMLVGVELLKSSFNGILNPEPVSMSIPMLIALLVSIPVKLWMYSYNHYMSKRINSTMLEATAKDSLNDCISTGAVIVTAVLELLFAQKSFEGTFWRSIPLDGIIGTFVSLLILWGGFSVARETVGLLLGGKADEELVKKLGKIVMGGNCVVGVHDLIVHDYGPGRIIASVHAEVPSDGDIMKIHEEIDEIEQIAQRELGILLVVHMDPVVVGNEKVDSLKKLTETIVKSFDESYMIHDFRITDGENRINLIFDMVVPHGCDEKKQEEAVNYIKEQLKKESPAYWAVIKVENSY